MNTLSFFEVDVSRHLDRLPGLLVAAQQTRAQREARKALEEVKDQLVRAQQATAPHGTQRCPCMRGQATKTTHMKRVDTVAADQRKLKRVVHHTVNAALRILVVALTVWRRQLRKRTNVVLLLDSLLVDGQRDDLKLHGPSCLMWTSVAGLL
eukprot:6213446-Pleurochrysis_carterae.AAC.4